MTKWRRPPATSDARPLHVAVVSQNADLALDLRPRAEAEALVAAGYRTTLVGGTDRVDTLRRLVAPGVDLCVYPFPHPAGGAAGQVREQSQAWLLAMRHLRSLSARAPVDVIHAGNPPDNGWLLARLLALVERRRIGFVFDQHDVAPVLLAEKFGDAWPMRGLHRVALALERASFRSADLVVFASTQYERRARDLHLLCGPGVVVPHGWRLPDSPLSAPPGEDRPAIAYVGMLSEQDCVLHLVEALALVPGIHDLRVVIAGDGSERPRAQQLAEELGIAGSIEWLGWVADREQLGALVHAARACVAPEHDSPFNRLASFVKLVEYMSAGAAVAAHRLPQTEALCGDTVEYARDMTPEALAEALATLLRDDKRAAELGGAARARFNEQIWWENVGRRRLVEAYAQRFGQPCLPLTEDDAAPARGSLEQK